MSFFKGKNKGNSTSTKVDSAVIPTQNTHPVDNSKLWIDTSSN